MMFFIGRLNSDVSCVSLCRVARIASLALWTPEQVLQPKDKNKKNNLIPFG